MPSAPNHSAASECVGSKAQGCKDMLHACMHMHLLQRHHELVAQTWVAKHKIGKTRLHVRMHMHLLLRTTNYKHNRLYRMSADTAEISLMK